MTLAWLRPNSLVAYRVYVVVLVGWTTTEVPRTGPTLGLMMRIEAPVTDPFNVAMPPLETWLGVAVREAYKLNCNRYRFL